MPRVSYAPNFYKDVDSLSDYDDDRCDLISDGRIEEEDTKYDLDQELEEED
ncbi:hypothetical protein F3Y22_tig00117017pilonHSYRG00487 [Hibiscus syriacus]|uniref:Uncharacterized protein n=1 Tax=Hibiscus syriacus TaxID=106335 RepID=A0A6A2XBR7_HIBSY|nr:hypothetical protein F3Y22_tig00117017pilonHSYRG00487 [Hibiscus syriacus]